jgi:hypothetical protein
MKELTHRALKCDFTPSIVMYDKFLEFLETYDQNSETEKNPLWHTINIQLYPSNWRQPFYTLNTQNTRLLNTLTNRLIAHAHL